MEKEVWILLFKVMNFVILVVLLYKLLAKRVKEFFLNRSSAIEKEIEEAERLNKEAEEKQEKIDSKLRNIEKEIDRIIEEFREDGLKEKEKIIENAKIEAEKIKQKATREI